jgi:hypothetical protein
MLLESDVAILVCRFIDERGGQAHTWAAEDLQRRDQSARKAKGRRPGNPGRSISNRNMFQQIDELRFPHICNWFYSLSHRLISITEIVL